VGIEPTNCLNQAQQVYSERRECIYGIVCLHSLISLLQRITAITRFMDVGAPTVVTFASNILSFLIPCPASHYFLVQQVQALHLATNLYRVIRSRREPWYPLQLPSDARVNQRTDVHPSVKRGNANACDDQGATIFKVRTLGHVIFESLGPGVRPGKHPA